MRDRTLTLAVRIHHPDFASMRVTLERRRRPLEGDARAVVRQPVVEHRSLTSRDLRLGAGREDRFPQVARPRVLVEGEYIVSQPRPLAVFAPRHATNLLRLKAFFARQWRAMPASQFMAVFGFYAERITQILDRYPAAVLAAASSAVVDSDDELPLRPEELSS